MRKRTQTADVNIRSVDDMLIHLATNNATTVVI